MQEVKKILAFNLGSTSTKIAYYENDQCIVRESISHPADETKQFKNISDQYEYRRQAVLSFMQRNGISLDELDAVTSRGGMTEPFAAGTYRISEAMIAQNNSGKYGVHICGVGLQIAYEMTRQCKAQAFTVDTPTTDEFEPLARYSGVREIPRISSFQALNQKAMSRYYAERIGRAYEELNLITVMLGGGISVVVHKNGRMIDGPDALEGDGPFSNNRAGTVPAGPLIKMCFSGKYTFSEMMYKINGEGGLMSYLGTTDIRAVEARIRGGDAEAAEVMEAMCYQTAKEVGACATVLKGKVDAILLIGGMANSEYLTGLIRDRVSFIAPVVILPGEREMESLCLNTYQALTGEIEVLDFVPREK